MYQRAQDAAPHTSPQTLSLGLPQDPAASHWDPVSWTTWPLPTPGHPGPYSQRSQDPAPLTSGQEPPISGHASAPGLPVPWPHPPLGKHINLRIFRAQPSDMLGPNFIHQWARTNLETRLIHQWAGTNPRHPWASSLTTRKLVPAPELLSPEAENLEPSSAHSRLGLPKDPSTLHENNSPTASPIRIYHTH